MPRTKMTSRKMMGGELLTKELPNPRRHKLGGVKKPRRYRPGTVALREIRKYQTTTDTLIPKLSFQRLVKEVVWNVCRSRGIPTMRMQSTALLAMQVACEDHLVNMFQKSQIAAIHGNRVSVQPKDMQIVQYFGGETVTKHDS